MPEGKKTYILDTNVLIHDPKALSRFKEHLVVIPLWVVEEMDRLKGRSSEKPYVQYAARSVIRKLRELMKIGSLREGVQINKSGGVLKIDSTLGTSSLPGELDNLKADNQIIAVAMKYREQGAILVTNDGNMAIKAQFCGLEAEEYRSDKLIDNIDNLYSGFAELKVSDGSVLTVLGTNKRISAAEAVNSSRKKLQPNQCCRLVSGDNYLLAIYRKKTDEFVLVPKESAGNGRVKPRNDEQKIALALLLDPRVMLVTLMGHAGTGKTLVSLLAGYLQRHLYKRITVFRPHIEAGGGMGFLPGSLEEKFAIWAKPIVGNYELIVGTYDAGALHKDREPAPMAKKGKASRRVKDSDFVPNEDAFHGGKVSLVEEAIRQGLLEIIPMDYERGNNRDETFLIVDEAQNMTPHQLKTIITRAGKGTKVVLIGDVTQIDNDYLTSETNGLTHVIEKFKGQEVFGHITMVKGERSLLAELAAKLL